MSYVIFAIFQEADYYKAENYDYRVSTDQACNLFSE